MNKYYYMYEGPKSFSLIQYPADFYITSAQKSKRQLTLGTATDPINCTEAVVYQAW